MSISISSACSSMPAAMEGFQSTQINPTSDSDGGSRHGHLHKVHRGRGGQMRDVVMQALQTLGVSIPQPTSGTSAPNPLPAPVLGDDTSGGSTPAMTSIKQDVRQLMHALFQAAKGEGTADTAPTGAASTDRKADFAARLSSLISKIGGGFAPVDLQSAFSKLMADLQQATTASSDIAATDASVKKPQPTLQAFLNQLQQNLGYGASGVATIGNTISTLA